MVQKDGITIGLSNYWNVYHERKYKIITKFLINLLEPVIVLIWFWLILIYILPIRSAKVGPIRFIYILYSYVWWCVILQVWYYSDMHIMLAVNISSTIYKERDWLILPCCLPRETNPGNLYWFKYGNSDI